jgi:O-antigen/teichoic acid export membrane protein
MNQGDPEHQRNPGIATDPGSATTAQPGDVAAAEKPPSPSLRRLAIRGTLWTIGGFGASQFVRLAGNLVLTRLLAPDLFGLMNLAQTALAGLSMFSDIGTSANLVRSPRGEDPAFVNTAWTLQVLRGLWLTLGMLLLTVPFAYFYGDERLLWLVPVLGLNGLITGLGSTSIYVLNRRLDVGCVARYELGVQMLSLTAMIACVWARPTLASLAVGTVLGAAIRVGWSHLIVAGPRNTLTWDRTAIRELMGFGKWVFLSTAALFLGEQTDRLVLGKLLSFEMLGVYGVAATLADVPRQVSAALNAKVVFPAIARIATLPREEIREKIERNRRPLILAGAAGLAALIAFGDLVVQVLYDKRYHGAGWILPLLGLSIWPRLLCNTNEPALYAIGRPQYSTLANTLRFVATLVGLPLGYHWYGIPGAILATALRDVPYYVAANFGLWRERLGSLWQDARATLLLVLLIAILLGARQLAGWGTPLDGIQAMFP